jgi:hypothetical protein
MNLPAQKPTDPPTAGGYLNRFLGGPPLSVIFRLALLSILIGVIMQVLGFDPGTSSTACDGWCNTSGTWGSTPCAGSGDTCSWALRW